MGPWTAKGPGRFEPERLNITWADGTVLTVTAAALDDVPYWDSEIGSWRLPPGTVLARPA